MTVATFPQPTDRVVVSGDLHCDVAWARRVNAVAKEARCDVVVQVGDFGWWPDRQEGREMLDALADDEVTWVFVEGNHDDLDDLARVASGDRAGCDPNGLWGPTEPIELARNLWWAARGARWRWGGRTFGALGGAWSPAWYTRVRGVEWFPNETIRRRDLVALGTTPVDVLVCHDAPAAALDEAGLVRGSQYARDGDRHIGRGNQLMVETAASATAPRLIFHGHWHRDHVIEWEAQWGPCRVVGLSSNQHPGSAAVLELETLSLQTLDLKPAALAD